MTTSNLEKLSSLEVDPTFPGTATIQRAGKAPAAITFTCKYRERAEFKAFVDNLNGRENVDVIMDIASGWDLADPFDKANITKLCDRFVSAPKAILNMYMDEITGARAKNS